MRERKNTSTFSNAGRTMTQVGSAPISVGREVGKGVLQGGMGVMSGVGSVGGFAGRQMGLMKKKDKMGDVNGAAQDVPNGDVTEQDFAVDQPGNGLTSVESGHGETLTATDPAMASALTDGAAASESGMLSVTCVSAQGLAAAGSHDAKMFVQLKLGERSQKTGHGKPPNEPEW